MQQENCNTMPLGVHESHEEACKALFIVEEFSITSDIATGSARLISTKKEGVQG
jgi:hypothetical protein